MFVKKEEEEEEETTPLNESADKHPIHTVTLQELLGIIYNEFQP